VPTAAGDTFLLTRGTGTTPHLWVVLWGPAGAARALLSVYLTTLRPHSDRTCILVPGDHPFIQHDTAVAYGEVQRWTDERLEQLIADGIAKPRQPVAPALLERLRAGFFASARTPHAMIGIARSEFRVTAPGEGG
jgi:hypothetical protein